MAKVNDGGNEINITTPNVRLTADTPGGALGFVLLGKVLGAMLGNNGLITTLGGMDTANKPGAYRVALPEPHPQIGSSNFALLVLPAGNGSTGYMAQLAVRSLAGGEQYGVYVRTSQNDAYTQWQSWEQVAGTNLADAVLKNASNQVGESFSLDGVGDINLNPGEGGSVKAGGKEVAVKDDLPEGITDLGNMTDDEAFDTKTTPGFYKYTFGTPSKDGYLVVTTDNNIIQEGGGASALYQIRFEGLNILYRSLATSGSWDASFKKMDLNTTIGGKEGTGGQREAIDSSNYKLWQFIEPGFYRFQPTVFERFTDRPSEITSISGSRNYALLVLGANFTAADYPNSNTVSQILMDFPSVSGGSSTYEPTMWVRIVNTTDGNPGSYGSWRKIGGGSSVEVVQSTGQSTTSVMSQKAVTNTIGNLFSDVMRDEGLYEDVDTLGETVSRTSTNGEQVSYINHRIEEYAVGADDPNIFTYDGQVHTLKLAQFTVHPQEGDLSFIADNNRGVLLDPTWSYVNFICSNEPRYFSARIGGGKCVLVDTNGDTSGDHYIQLFAEAAYSASSGGIDVTIFAEYKLSGGGEENNPIYINGNLSGYLRIWIV